MSNRPAWTFCWQPRPRSLGSDFLASDAIRATIISGEIIAVPSRNISLTDHFDGFVERSIRAGRFANASQVVRAGLHLLERREQEQAERRAALQAAATEGFGALDRGDGVLLDGEQALRQRLRDIGRAARAGVATPAE